MAWWLPTVCVFAVSVTVSMLVMDWNGSGVVLDDEPTPLTHLPCDAPRMAGLPKRVLSGQHGDVLTLKRVQVVTRHGDRTPKPALEDLVPDLHPDLHRDEFIWKSELSSQHGHHGKETAGSTSAIRLGALTARGEKQQQRLGQDIGIYKDYFLDVHGYDGGTVLRILSSPISRAQRSARLMFHGLFGGGSGEGEDIPPLDLSSLTTYEVLDYLYPNGDLCPAGYEAYDLLRSDHSSALRSHGGSDAFHDTAPRSHGGSDASHDTADTRHYERRKERAKQVMEALSHPALPDTHVDGITSEAEANDMFFIDLHYVMHSRLCHDKVPTNERRLWEGVSHQALSDWKRFCSHNWSELPLSILYAKLAHDITESEEPLLIYSSHDSTLCGIVNRLTSKQSTPWPPYNSHVVLEHYCVSTHHVLPVPSAGEHKDELGCTGAREGESGWMLTRVLYNNQQLPCPHHSPVYSVDLSSEADAVGASELKELCSTKAVIDHFNHPLQHRHQQQDNIGGDGNKLFYSHVHKHFCNSCSRSRKHPHPPISADYWTKNTVGATTLDGLTERCHRQCQI